MLTARSSSRGALLIVLLMVLGGCRTRMPEADLRHVVDPCAEPIGQLLERDDLERIADAIQQHAPAVPPRRKSILVLTGGGSDGAYPAGVLYGWSELGTRPHFDVVTGISVGALVGALAFLGPEKDEALRRFFTESKTSDIYRIRPLRALAMGEYLAESEPLQRMIESFATPEYMRRVAAEHASGRRFYVGTTALEGRRLTVWDMGAIAAKGTAESRDLYVKVLLASASIPVLLPPVRIPLTVDGEPIVSRHTDGGATTALFLRLPRRPGEVWVGPESPYFGSDLYTIVAGRLAGYSQPVEPRFVSVGVTSFETLNLGQVRDELLNLYTGARMNGMRFHVTAIPREYKGVWDPARFDPVEMTRLFDEGRRQIHSGQTWRNTPPGLGPNDHVGAWADSHLRRKSDHCEPCQPER